MLYHFLKNMLDILRLRYKHPAEYTYPLPVILAVLLLLGMINAAAMSALFGKDAAAVVFSILLTAVKWLILSRFTLLRRTAPAASGIYAGLGSPEYSNAARFVCPAIKPSWPALANMGFLDTGNRLYKDGQCGRLESCRRLYCLFHLHVDCRFCTADAFHTFRLDE